MANINICSLSISIDWIYNCHRGEICIWLYDIDSGIQRICNSLNYNIICPCSLSCHINIIHVVLPRVFIACCFLYTTQGDAEDVELQDSVYKNDNQGCYLADVIPHWKNSFHLPIHWPEFYQVQKIWIPIMKLNWLVWHMEHFKCTIMALLIWVKDPGFFSTSPLNVIMRWAMQPMVFVH